MIGLPSGVRVWLATGRTDMRKGFDGLALLVQETLLQDPHGGHLFVFRGRRGDLIKVLWHDGQGLCLFAPLDGLGVRAAGARQFHLTGDERWSGLDHAGAARLFAGRDRLASAATELGAASGGLSAAF